MSVVAVIGFLLELAVYASAGYWGYTHGTRLPVRVTLAVAAIAVFAVVWGLFGAPSATWPTHGLVRVVLNVVWFGCGAVLLAASLRERQRRVRQLAGGADASSS
jgi:hypothetical protein